MSKRSYVNVYYIEESMTMMKVLEVGKDVKQRLGSERFLMYHTYE